VSRKPTDEFSLMVRPVTRDEPTQKRKPLSYNHRQGTNRPSARPTRSAADFESDAQTRDTNCNSLRNRGRDSVVASGERGLLRFRWAIDMTGKGPRKFFRQLAPRDLKAIERLEGHFMQLITASIFQPVRVIHVILSAVLSCVLTFRSMRVLRSQFIHE